MCKKWQPVGEYPGGHLGRNFRIPCEEDIVCRCSSESKPAAGVGGAWHDVTSGCQHSGYLLQHRSTRLKTTQRRFCVLRNTSVLCYKSDTDFRPLLCLPVDEDGYRVVYRCTGKSGKPVVHELRFIKPGYDTHLFSADTEDQARRWVQVLLPVGLSLL